MLALAHKIKLLVGCLAALNELYRDKVLAEISSRWVDKEAPPVRGSDVNAFNGTGGCVVKLVCFRGS